MKLLFIVFSLFSFSSIAQVTVPYAPFDVMGDIVTSIHGNNDLNNIAEIGSRQIGMKSGNTGNGFTGMRLNIKAVDSGGLSAANNSDIGFYTWGNGISTSREVVRITERGRVGIGTTNPTEALSIVGNTIMTGALTINATGTTNSLSFPTSRGSNGQVLTTNGTGGIVWTSPTVGSVTGTGTDSHIMKWLGTNVAQDSGIIIDSSDNVTGMGTLNGRTISNWTEGAGSSTDNGVAAFSGTNGKALKDTTVLYTNLVTKTTAFTAVNRVVLAGGNNKTLTETAYAFPTADSTVSGYVLKSNAAGVVSWAIDANTVTTVEDLLTSSSTVNALSANQGRILDGKITPLTTASHTHANKTTLDVIKNNGTATEFLAGDGTYKVPVDTNTVTTIVDNLTSTSATSALSANQGKVLNDKITPLQTASHTHANKALLDTLISNGAATLFLAADGTYKTPIDTNTVTVVENILTSTSSVNALSSGQGKVLNDKITPLQTASHSHTNKTVIDAIPSTMCTSGQILKSIGATFTCQADVDTDTNSGGTVNGSGGSVDNRIVAWSGTTGTVIKDSGVLYTDIVKGPSTATDFAIARFDLGTGKLIQNSGVTIDDANNIEGVANLTVKGNNSNTPANLTSAVEFVIGRNNAGAMASGQTSADLAFGYGGGGFRHYIQTTHNSVAGTTSNSINFYMNNGGTSTTSSAPGTGNVLAMGITPVGVGVMNTAPAEALDVTGNIKSTGQIYSTVYNNVASLAFNFNNGNVQYTTASCGASTLTNMVEGGSYQVIIKGTTAATCVFTHAGVTFRYSPANGNTTAASHSVYSMTRAGNIVYVSWITGF